MNQREELRVKWEEVVKTVSQRFAEGDELDLDAIIFLIGVQELGMGFRKFKKDEKVNLMHVAICRLLEPYGYYIYEGRDREGWPHYKSLEKIPSLKPGEQSWLMKEAVVRYFDDQGL